MPFRINLDGNQWLVEDLLIDEAISVEEETNHPWEALTPLRSAATCKAIVVTFLSRGMSRADAVARVSRMTVKELWDAIEIIDGDEPAATPAPTIPADEVKSEEPPASPDV